METEKLSTITITDFNDLLNKSIDISFSENITLQAELIEITKFDSYNQSSRIPFSLVFRTDQKTEYFNQGIYKLHHPLLGDIELFFVPIGPDKVGMRYEANFS